jgi:hypothetical protein
MPGKLLNLRNTFTVLFALLFAGMYAQQTTAYSTDFSTSAGTSYSTTNGLIGSSTSWYMLRSGTDMGAMINSGYLSLTNDATGSSNVSGWILAYTTAQASPYNAVLSSNAGTVTWTFNMRQIRANPSSMANGYYGNAFILAGATNTTATTGTGYAVILGESGKTDRLRLVRYTAGLRTNTTLMMSNTTGLNDFGNQYLSVKVTYVPSSNTWQLYVRNDGSSFQDPASGTLTSQGTVVNNASTTTSLPLLGAFWNAATRRNQTSFFDNIRVTVDTPYLNSISPTSRVAGTGAFTLTVNGGNFTSASAIRWNGTALTTTYVSANQLTASVPAANITSAGTASIMVATGAAVSSAQTFTIDPAGVPSISTSTNSIPGFNTITGTASASQSFTSTGANLTSGSITITAPANFELASTSGGTYSSSLNVTAATTSTFVRVSASAPAGLYTGNVTLTTTGGATKQIAVSATVLTTEPTTSATGVTFSGTTSIGTTINWTNGNGSNHLVVVKSGSAVDGSPVDGVIYTASTAFGAGSEIGTGGYVVYKGASNSVTLSGLSPTTTYYVSVFGLNGSGGTENYRIATPATGNVTTLNAPVGWQITAANTRYTINFDTTVEGVNMGTYAGGGLSTDPGDGELNSNAFVYTALTTGAATFGGEVVEDDLAYGNGQDDGGVTDTGLYSFKVADNNYALGFQPGGDYVSGTTTLRLQNQTGAAITSLNVGYKVYVYNDEAGANSYNFSYSANNSTYTAGNVLDLSTTAVADALPGWKMYYKAITITGLNIANNAYYYLRWSGNSVSGTVYDEIALDDVQVVANPSTVFTSLSGTVQTAVLAGNVNLTGATTLSGDITFNNGKLYVGANTLTLNGTVTNTTTGGLSGGSSSNVTISGAVSPTLSFDQTTVGTTNLLNNLSINTSANNTVTLGNNLALNGALTVDESQTFALGASTLTGSLTTINNNGTVTTTNTTTTPFTSGRTWGGIGTLILNATTAAQYLPAGTYNKVTVNTTGGGNATGNITLNGNLHLPNANVSATKGAFDTGTYTITMAPTAANTGVGDVSGITSRTSGIANSTLYTFGHPRTSIIFPVSGTLPTAMSIKLVLGSAPTGKTDGILRTYDFIQTGGTGTKALISAHYLDSELNSNTESRLVDWVVQVSPLQVIEQSRTNYNTTDNYVELANVNVAFFSSTFGAKLLTLANSQVTSATWNGSVSTSWTTAANWTPNAVPSDATKVVIPDAATTPNDPILNATVTIGALSIESGGILNSPSGSQLIITTATGAWINYGTFNAADGTVTFNAASATGDVTMAGSTTFNNVTIPSGTILRPLTNNIMSIGGTFTKSGTLAVGSVHNTVIYSGTNQTIVVPDGYQNSYHNLTITGAGAIFPASLNITGDLITNQTVDFSNKTISMIGVDAEGQRIGGTVSPSFYNLTLNKPSGSGTLILQNNVSVSNTLTLSSGLFDIANYDLTLGANPVAGTFSVTSMIDADGTGHVRRPFTATGSYTFPVGETTSNTTYSPITVNVTSGTFSNAYVSVNVTDATHPNNYATDNYLTRYWGVTQTGITNAVATITGTYVTGDAVGGESALIAAQLNGTFNAVTNPWIRFSTLGSNTLTASGATLTAGQTSYFTGIKGSAIAVEITGGGSFCQNSAVTLSSTVSGGVGNYTYSWSNGLGSTSTAVPPTSAVGSTTYTLTVRDANGATGTATASVVVTARPVAGTLSANQSICANTTPAAITLSGYTGNIVRWERSTTTAFANPTFIASTSATLTGAQIGTGLTSTRYLRAVVQNGACDVVYSNYVEVKINTTTWDGTAWDNGSPTATDAVVFNGNYAATGSFSACTVVVNNGTNVIIPSGYTVSVNGAVTVNTGGTFVFEDNAALLQVNAVTNTGNITIKKKSGSLYRLDYTLWSAPVTGQQLQAFSPLTASERFYYYNYGQNSSGNWMEGYFHTDAAGNFERAKAYLVRMPNSSTAPGYNNGSAPTQFEGEFTGVPNNGTVTVPLSTQGDKYTGVGNPYPSPINIADFFAANNASIDITSGIYLWRKKNNSTNSSYAVINQSGFIANSATGGGSDQGVFFSGSYNSWLITQGQGFLVKTLPSLTSATLRFTNAMRRPSAGASQNFFRQGADTASRLWLNLVGENNAAQALVAYLEEGTLGLDYGFDAQNIVNDGFAEIYSMAQDVPLAIQARPEFNSNDVVSIGYTAPDAGTYTISLDHTDGVFQRGQKIYLRDNQEGIIRELTRYDYSFATTAGNHQGRFDILYTTTTLDTDEPVLDSNNVIVYIDGKTIGINSGKALMDNVTIYDVSGRKLYSKNNIDDYQVKINNLVAEQQVLLLEISTDKGKVTKRIIF